MILRSIIPIIADAIVRADLRGCTESHLYDLAVQALVRARPDLTRSTAARVVNELLEIADPTGLMDRPRADATVDAAMVTSQKTRVREIAYQLWEASGKPQGRDLEFWCKAELQVSQDEFEVDVRAPRVQHR